MARTRTRLLLAGAGLVALFAAVAIAHAAGPKIKTHTHSVSLADSENGSATVRCRHGTKPIGGGVRFKPVNFKSYLLNETLSGHGWNAHAHQGVPGGGSKLVVSVRCIADTKIIKRFHSKTTPAGTVTSTKATCPKHSVAVSGGVSAPGAGGDDSYIGASFPVGNRTWKAKMVRSPGGDSTMRVTVLCVKGAKVSHARASTDLFPDDNPFKLPATCQKGQVSGGGVLLSDPVDDYLHATYPKGRSWVAQATRRTGPLDNSRITTYAVCLKSL